MGSDIFRVFSFFDKGNLVILVNGFQKKTQKTPKSEIKMAEKLNVLPSGFDMYIESKPHENIYNIYLTHYKKNENKKCDIYSLKLSCLSKLSFCVVHLAQY